MKIPPCNPQQPDRELVFDAPWQARTFALALKLQEAGIFTWTEWSDRLAEEIAEWEKQRPVASNDDYYMIWQSALEALVKERIDG